jgi:hypothetical protein
MKVLAIAFATLMLVLTASAQNDSLEVNGNYMFSHYSSNNVSNNIGAGWDANLNIPLFSSKGLGLLADFSGAFAGADLDNVHLFTYGGGFQYTIRHSDAFQPYVNVTMGDASFHTNFTGVNKLYFSPGGGVDFHVAGGWWVRGGVNYIHTGLDGQGINGVRIIGGLTYRF